MGENYHRKRIRGWGAWALLLLAASVPAMPVPAALSLGPLALPYSDAWLRADPIEEDAEDSFILRAQGGGAPLTLYAPRRSVPLKTDPDRFFRQLERVWRSRHGASAAISQVRIGGVAWVLCVRPGKDRDARVFHFVTVHQGHAYHLLAVREGPGAEMPEPVRDILAATRLAGGGAEEAVGSAAVAPSPGDPAGPGQAGPPPVLAAGVAPEAPNSAGADPGPSVAPRPWVLSRSRLVVPRGASLARAAEREADRISASGMLMGYGLGESADGMSWFMDGFILDPEKTGKAARRPFALNWRFRWELPGEGTYPAQARAGASIEGGVSGAVTEDAPGVVLEAWRLCGPPSGILDILVGPADSSGELEGRLAEGHACQEGERPIPLEADLPPEATVNVGQTRRDHVLTLSWPKPDRMDTGTPSWLLILRPRPSGREQVLGRDLLDEAAFYALYVLRPDGEAPVPGEASPGS